MLHVFYNESNELSLTTNELQASEQNQSNDPFAIVLFLNSIIPKGAVILIKFKETEFVVELINQLLFMKILEGIMMTPYIIVVGPKML